MSEGKASANLRRELISRRTRASILLGFGRSPPCAAVSLGYRAFQSTLVQELAVQGEISQCRRIPIEFFHRPPPASLTYLARTNSMFEQVNNCAGERCMVALRNQDSGVSDNLPVRLVVVGHNRLAT